MDKMTEITPSVACWQCPLWLFKGRFRETHPAARGRMRADGTGSLRERSKKGLIFVSRETGVTVSIAVSSFKFLLISYSRREKPSPPKSKPCLGAMNARGNNSGCSKGSSSKFPTGSRHQGRSADLVPGSASILLRRSDSGDV